MEGVAAILGVTSLVQPITVPMSVLTRQLPGVIFITVLLLPVLRTQWKIRRWEGVLLLAAYVGVGVFVLRP